MIAINAIFKLVTKEMGNYDILSANNSNKIASKLYSKTPKDEQEFLEICRYFMQQNGRGYYNIATQWLKKRKEVLTPENIPFFEDILYKDINGWGEVDQFCYRVLNPIFNNDYSLYPYLTKWSTDSNKDIRRASLVAMIISSGKLTLNYDYDKMITLVERLKNDSDFHVRKAVGWILKCAFVSYPDKVETYLRDNVMNLDRIIFRYALEHVENPLRDELIHLEYKR